MLTRLTSRLLLLTTCALAQGEIYKHVDAEGRITYSNIPSKGAKALDLGYIPRAIPAPKGFSPRASSSPTPASFPKVDSATQKSRDQTKLQILQDELAGEQKLLLGARQKLAGKPQDPLQRDNVTMHEKNIEALQKEISRAQ